MDIESPYSRHPAAILSQQVPLFPLPSGDTVVVDIVSPYPHCLAVIIFVVDNESPYSHRPAAIIFVVYDVSPYSHHPAVIMFIVDIKSSYSHCPAVIMFVVGIKSPYSHHSVAIMALWTPNPPIPISRAEHLGAWLTLIAIGGVSRCLADTHFDRGSLSVLDR